MVAPQRDLDPAASPVAFFGSELRRLREAIHVSQNRLAPLISFSQPYISAIELGARVPTPEFAQKCDEILKTDGALLDIWRRLDSAEDYPAWFKPFVEFEREATTLKTYELALIPGLFQTADYARALIRARQIDIGTERLDELIVARLKRQEILYDEDAPTIRVVLDSSVLRRKIGGPEVMGRQLQHLHALGHRQNVTIQVIPDDTPAHAGLTGSFVIASFGDGPDIVYLDTAVQGRIVRRRDDVSKIQAMFDSLCADALHRRASLELLAKMG